MVAVAFLVGFSSWTIADFLQSYGRRSPHGRSSCGRIVEECLNKWRGLRVGCRLQFRSLRQDGTGADALVG